VPFGSARLHLDAAHAALLVEDFELVFAVLQLRVEHAALSASRTDDGIQRRRFTFGARAVGLILVAAFPEAILRKCRERNEAGEEKPF
jgi:hypothetical protein